jgi:hypothetical protein
MPALLNLLTPLYITPGFMATRLSPFYQNIRDIIKVFYLLTDAQ